MAEIKIPAQERGTFDDAGNHIYTSKYFTDQINKYKKVIAQAGPDSQVAENLMEKHSKLLADYGNGKFDIAPDAYREFVDFLQTFGGQPGQPGQPSDAGQLAFNRFERDLQALEFGNQGNTADDVANADATNDAEPTAPVEPTHTPTPTPSPEEIQEIRTELESFRIRSTYSDANQYMLDRVAADVYLDMGIITAAQHAKSGPKDTIEIIGKIPDLTGDKAIEFSERFIDRIAGNQDLFEMAPPTTLANAYNATKDRIASGKGDKDALNARLEKLANRMDSLSADFKDRAGYYYTDTSNIADVYDGYNKMFDARGADLDKTKDADKISAIEQNRASLEEFIKEYDKRWGLNGVKAADAPKLEKRWDDLRKRLNGVKISEETLKLAQKYKFLDENGKPIPQFRDAAGAATISYKKGHALDAGGRLSRVIELAKHDIALQNVAHVDKKINNAQLESDVNERIPLKLFEIDTADKVMQGALENPEQFTDPKYLEQFVNDLEKNGGEISNNGYEAAMDAQVNQTGGFLGRLKSKLKDGAKKVGGFFGKVFKPLSDIDKRANDRVSGGNGGNGGNGGGSGGNGDGGNRRKKRIDFFIRLLKGFGSAFLVSATITTIATAAAAMSGIGLAVSLAVVGVTVGIASGAYQIYKWRERQRAAGQPTDITALFKDTRMIATLGTTALASIAMIFGAAGIAEAALPLGYGALALGGTNNAIAMYKDAKSVGMSTKESLAWSFANVIAVLGGGVAGRMTAAAGIEAYNAAKPENTIFQNKTVTTEIQQESITQTREVYDQDALDNARKITQSWYRDNPAELQHRVDLINEYNSTHGTTIDPYRAILLNADAGGHTFDNMALHMDGGGVTHSGANHNVINTEVWRNTHGFSQSEMTALKNLFMGDQINPDGLDVAMRVDRIVSANNEVGSVSYGDKPHYDGVLPRNTVDANGRPVFNTYTDGDSVFHSETITILNDKVVNVENFTPVDIPWGLGMFGVSYPRTPAEFKDLKDRVGSIMDKIGQKEKSEPTPEPKPTPKPAPAPKPAPGPVPTKDEDQPALPKHLAQELKALEENFDKAINANDSKEQNKLLPKLKRKLDQLKNKLKSAKGPAALALRNAIKKLESMISGLKDRIKNNQKEQLVDNEILVLEDETNDAISKNNPKAQDKLLTKLKRKLDQLKNRLKSAKGPMALALRNAIKKLESMIQKLKDRMKHNQEEISDDKTALDENISELPELNLTRAQAKKLDDLDAQIKKVHSVRNEKSLNKKKADELWAKQKKLEQNKRELLNLIAQENNLTKKPDGKMLDLAKNKAYARQELQDLQNKLDLLKKRHTDKMGKHELALHRQELAQTKEMINTIISFLEDPANAAIIGAEYTTQVTPTVQTPESKKTAESEPTILDNVVKKIKSGGKQLKKGFQKAEKNLREMNKENFGIGQDFDDEMTRQEEIRKKLSDEYADDLTEQEKNLRKHHQNLARMRLKNPQKS